MFRLPELDCFNAMLTRLYKQELEEIVMRYEGYRFVNILYIYLRRPTHNKGELSLAPTKSYFLL